MEQITPKPSKPAVFPFVTAGLAWGILTAFLITLSNWHHTGHLDSHRNMLGRFAIFMAVGAIGNLARWKWFPDAPRKPASPPMARLRFVLFVALMLALAYAAWRMS
jgi:drug/metabolite transporter (DMT)-like permease